MTVPGLIFLDIDGVANSLGTAIAFGKSYDDQYWSPVSINLLKSLTERTRSSIVLTSTKRKDYATEEECIRSFKEIFKFYNWDIPLIGRTTSLGYRENELTKRVETRGHEINLWLKENGSRVCYNDNWIIVDDDSDFMPHQMARHVKTTFCEGFNFISYVQALNLLGYTDFHLNVHAESTLNHFKTFKI